MSVQDELLATGGEDRQVRIWDLRTPLKAVLALGPQAPPPQGATSTLAHSARVRGIAGIPWAGQDSVPGVVSATSDGVVRVWDLRKPGGAGAKGACVGEHSTGARLTCIAAVSPGAAVGTTSGGATAGGALLSGAKKGGGEPIENGGSAQKRPKERPSDGQGQTKKAKVIQEGKQGLAGKKASQHGGEGGTKKSKGRQIAKGDEGHTEANRDRLGRIKAGLMGPAEKKQFAPGNSEGAQAKKSGPLKPNSKGVQRPKGGPTGKLEGQGEKRKPQVPS